MSQDDVAAEHKDLFKLILKANQVQTQEIQAQFKNTVESLSTELKEATREIESLKQKCNILERKLKENNIVIFGINTEETENITQTTIGILNENFETNIREEHINKIHKLGKAATAPILVQFISYQKKRQLFDSKKLNKLREKGLSISDDLLKEDREELKLLKYHLKNARLQNHEAKIKGLKLFINGKPYSLQELKELESHNIESSEEQSSDEEKEKEENQYHPNTKNKLNQPPAEKNSNLETDKNKQKPVSNFKNTRSGNKGKK